MDGNLPEKRPLFFVESEMHQIYNPVDITVFISSRESCRNAELEQIKRENEELRAAFGQMSEDRLHEKSLHFCCSFNFTARIALNG